MRSKLFTAVLVALVAGAVAYSQYTPLTEEATGNALTLATLTVSGASTLTGAVTCGDDITCDTLILVDAETGAAPTNAVSDAIAITVDGATYWLGLYPAND